MISIRIKKNGYNPNYIFVIVSLILILLGLDYSKLFFLGLGRNVIRAVLLCILTVSYFIVYVSQKRIKIAKKWINIVLLLYLVLITLSGAYSVIPLETIVKSYEMMLAFLYVQLVIQLRVEFYYITNFVEKVLLLIQTYNILGALLNATLFTQWSRGLIPFQINGLLHPNANGSISALLIFMIIRKLLNREKSFYLYYGLLQSICMLVISQSRTSLAILACLLLLVLFENRKRMIFVVASIVATTMGLVLNSTTLFSYFVRGQSTENFKTMSGRTKMWESAYQVFKVNPLMGLGFGAGSDLVLRNTENNISSLHNGYLESLTGVGLFGLTLILIVNLIALIEILKRVLFNSDEIILVLGIFTYSNIRMLTSMGFGAWYSLDMYLFMLCIIFALKPIER